MWEINLNETANLIILISAVIVAVKTIYQFFKKPVDDIADRARKSQDQYIEQILDEKMPKFLEKNCETLMASLNEIKEMTFNQEQRLIDIQKSIDLLNVSQLDMLRYNMNRIYYKYRPYQKILDADKKAFIKLYNDYKEMKGNTWIDALYAELKEWPIVENEDELKT